MCAEGGRAVFGQVGPQDRGLPPCSDEGDLTRLGSGAGLRSLHLGAASACRNVATAALAFVWGVQAPGVGGRGRAESCPVAMGRWGLAEPPQWVSIGGVGGVWGWGCRGVSRVGVLGE